MLFPFQFLGPGRDLAARLRTLSVTQFGLDWLFDILDRRGRIANQIVSARFAVFLPSRPKNRPLEFSVPGE
jgi:hypothetical protein